MDSAAFHSLTPLLDEVDQWKELAPLLPILVALELVLSADNAIALAAIARNQSSRENQRLALNIGIFLALIFRIILILMAQWVLKYKLLQFVAGTYLLFLFGNKLITNTKSATTDDYQYSNGAVSRNLIKTVLILAFTDLAFSLDSVAAAVAISDQFLLVTTGAIIGVIALRFTSGLFVQWLELYTRLEMAGYLAVGLVGFKLIILLTFTELIIPEWVTMLVIIAVFVWGFSNRSEESIG